MGECINKSCVNYTSHRLRCGYCRKYNIYQCSNCGLDLYSPRKTKCEACLINPNRWKKYYRPHPVIKVSTKMTKLFRKKNYISLNEICSILKISNGTARTVIYNMRKSGIRIINVNNRYILL